MRPPFKVIDLAGWAGPGGPSFQQGSLRLFYRGKDFLLGAQIKIVDSPSSLIFDEQLVEPTAMSSSQLEGLWWLPTRNSKVTLAISNTSASAQIASLDVDGVAPKQVGSKVLILRPHQTVLINPAQDLSDRPTAVLETGGISISHSGAPGALIARTMIQDPSIGFSSSLHLTDPRKAKSSSLHISRVSRIPPIIDPESRRRRDIRGDADNGVGSGKPTSTILPSRRSSSRYSL
jgi:hypothetical protein